MSIIPLITKHTLIIKSILALYLIIMLMFVGFTNGSFVFTLAFLTSGTLLGFLSFMYTD